MIKHIIGNFGVFEWLISMATFGYILVMPLAAVSVWSLLVTRVDRRALIVFFLPICWLLPLMLAGAFTDWTTHESKTASWVGGVGFAAAVFQVVWSIFAGIRMKRLRWLATAGVVVNALIALPSWAVVVMDASGDWI